MTEMIEDFMEFPVRTPEQLLDDLEHCKGPCGEMCVRCREAYHLRDIYEVLKKLMEENKELKLQLNKK